MLNLFQIGLKVGKKKNFYISKNQHKVSFHQSDYNPQIKSFWVKTKIHFSEDNGNLVYKQVKKLI